MAQDPMDPGTLDIEAAIAAKAKRKPGRPRKPPLSADEVKERARERQAKAREAQKAREKALKNREYMLEWIAMHLYQVVAEVQPIHLTGLTYDHLCVLDEVVSARVREREEDRARGVNALVPDIEPLRRAMAYVAEADGIDVAGDGS